MSLEIVAKPSGDGLLLTTDMVRGELGNSSPFDEDTFILRLIREATDYVESYLGRPLGQRIYKESLGAWGAPRLVVTRYPLNAIGSIQEITYYDRTPSVNKIETSLYEIENSDSGFIFMREGFTQTHRYHQYVTRHPSRYLNPDWVIKYRAGYVLPGEGTSYSITDPQPESGGTGIDLSIAASDTDKGPMLPADIQRATLQIVKIWGLGLQDDPSVVQEKVGDASETRWSSGVGLGPTITGILDRHKEFFFEGGN